jgi:hypothetical protein
MTVGCLDAEDVHGGDGRRPWYDCHGADLDRRIDAGAGSICDCQLIGSSGYQNRFVTCIFNHQTQAVEFEAIKLSKIGLGKISIRDNSNHLVVL